MNLAAEFMNIAAMSLNIADRFKNSGRLPLDFEVVTNSIASVFNYLATVSVDLAAGKGPVASER
jgi:hypothetical protein